jgi:hypothetical protein
MKPLGSFLVLIFLTFAAASARAQSALPDSFGPWKGAEPVAQFARTSVPSADVLNEAGITAVEGRNYRHGNQEIAVKYEQFRDPSGAYEIYTAMLSTKPIRSASDADLKLLLDALKQASIRSPLPPIRGYLPDVDMVQGTQRYALGPAGFDAALQSLNESKFSAITKEICFAKGAEAMLAGYHSATGKTETLILVEYPTPQIAEQQLKHIQPILAANAESATATVERRNSLLSLVLSPVNAQSAASLRENIKYGIAITWNEGSHVLTDPPWLVTVKNIFIGTLAFCGITLVLGVAFGGVRVVTKKLFPGKVFDRPEDIEVLQLGLSGKRIDPRDFY